MNNKNNNNKTSLFGKKSVRAGGYSAIMSLIVIAVAIAVNLFVSALPSNIIKLDNSSIDIYTLTDDTKSRISALSEDVTIKLLAVTGNEDPLLKEMLDRYKALSPHITVKYIDPVVNPTLTDDITEENSLIIESARRSKTILNSEIKVKSYSYTSGYPVESTSFNGENAITSGIDFVTTEDIPKIYVLSGHSEIALGEKMSKAIKDDSMEIKDLSIIKTGNIPDDADCILINDPQQDITPDELKILTEYINGGGKLMLITGYVKDTRTNLASLMKQYGTSLNETIVLEDADHYNTYQTYIYPTPQSHEITSPLIQAKREVFMPVSLSITIDETLPTGVTVNKLLVTSNASYSKQPTAETTEKKAGDQTGPFNVGVAIEAGAGKIVWFSSSSVLDDNVDTYSAGGNSSMSLNSLGWMCEKQSSIKIRSISLDLQPLIIKEAESNIWTIALCVLVPVAVTGIGLAVWTKRRKR